MPIYAYRCDACGFAKDVLQKMSDPQLTECPSCGKPAFKKQVTAAGFQLKGSGWYATDFRGGSSGAGTAEKTGAAEKTGGSETAKTDGAATPAASGPSDTASKKTTPAD